MAPAVRDDVFSVTLDNGRRVPVGVLAESVWDESKFERDDRGRFADKVGGSPIKTAAFQEWFGASKVVDADGKPLVVYHGTGAVFDEFDESKIGSENDEGFWGRGFYFMDDPEWGSGYAEVAGEKDGAAANVMPVYLSLQKPYYYTERDDASKPKWHTDLTKLRDESKQWAQSFRARLESQGYDGIVLQGKPGAPTEYVAFKPTQIKSAIGNRGTFRKSSPNIKESADWDEDKHPRAPDGKFTDGPDQNDGGKSRTASRELPPEYDTPDPPAPDTSRGSPAWQSAREQLAGIINAAVDEMDASDKQPYRAAAARVLDRMNTKCLERVRTNSTPRFHGSESALHAAWSQATGKPVSEAYAKGVTGFYIASDYTTPGVINVDGQISGLSTQEVFAHEAAHAVDNLHVYSGDDEWYLAWGHEILDGDVVLSDYAKERPHEGFAEFGRLVWSKPEEAEKHFPKCFAFWKKHGLV